MAGRKSDKRMEEMAKKRGMLVVFCDHLRTATEIDGNCLSDAIKCLKEIGYEYDEEKYPPLDYVSVNTGYEALAKQGDGQGRPKPMTPAEALLWKLGKWSTYKDFIQQMGKDEIQNSDHIVIRSFALHLRGDVKPSIFDQHALRAMLAIGGIEEEHLIACFDYLFTKNDGNWKKTPTSSRAVDVEKAFQAGAKKIRGKNIGPMELDRLLMPLGKALKATCGSRSEFCEVCGVVEKKRASHTH